MQWILLIVGPQNGTSFMSPPFRLLEFWCGSYISGKYVHLCCNRLGLYWMWLWKTAGFPLSLSLSLPFSVLLHDSAQYMRNIYQIYCDRLTEEEEENISPPPHSYSASWYYQSFIYSPTDALVSCLKKY